MGHKSSKAASAAIITDLENRTKFSGAEIRKRYSDFMADIVDGEISLEQFKQHYSKLYPDGDSDMFATRAFRNFDTDSNMKIDFKEFMLGLNVTLKGTPEEKLKWAFQMYDEDGDQLITKQEMREMVETVYKMVKSHLRVSQDWNPEAKTEEIFEKMDKDSDGNITLVEFIQAVKADDSMSKLLLLDTSNDGKTQQEKQ